MPDNLVPTDSAEAILAQFSTAFTVRNLMTPRSDLIGADSLQEALGKHERHGFDVISYPSTGTIKGYFYQGKSFALLTPSDLVSCDTSLLDLLSLLAEREFFFALHGTQISGYVHFSDLNKPLMRTPFFILLEATERHLLSTLRHSVTEDQARNELSVFRINQIRHYLEAANQNRSDTTFWDVLGLRDILKIARRHDFARLSSTETLTEVQAEDLINLRNKVAHGGHLLVKEHSTVERLIDLQKLCTQLRQMNS
ncbi:hypothetical protein CCAX7_60030 [Capsulimonas corticalis]|uniref:Uncharacterized protein n=1 Tax=Capsulimonas corticalis TaxID=2219043 RepID=A0A402CZK1_9BACT|nr:hypothetical protein [Capsulimonas corticalis]BDI33952.1 hypothetical protein CCAX7_60030 [Capsulimonas corticalis]